MVKRWGDLEKLTNIRFSNACKSITTTVCDQGLLFFIFLCKHPGCHQNLGQMLTNHFRFFHSKDSYSIVFSLLHPATDINVTITRRHWDIQFSVSCKIMNVYRMLHWGQTWGTPCRQKDPGLISPLLPTTLLHLCMLFWQALSPLYVCLYPESFCLLPPFGQEFFQDRNHLFHNGAPLSIAKMTKRCLPVMIHGSLYFNAFPC